MYTILGRKLNEYTILLEDGSYFRPHSTVPGIEGNVYFFLINDEELVEDNKTCSDKVKAFFENKLFTSKLR